MVRISPALGVYSAPESSEPARDSLTEREQSIISQGPIPAQLMCRQGGLRQHSIIDARVDDVMTHGGAVDDLSGVDGPQQR